MRHRKDQAKLGRTASHRKAMLSNMVTSFFAAERIETTVPKARAARRLAERMITFARRGDLAARRRVARVVRDETVLKKLFDEIAPRYAARPGGYTRMLKLAKLRLGDSTRMAMLELVGKDDQGRKRKKAARKTYHKDMGPGVTQKGAEAALAAGAAHAAGAAEAPEAEAKSAAKAASKHEAPAKAKKAEKPKKAKKAPAKPKKAKGK